MWPYVTSLYLFCGMSFLLMKKIVFISCTLTGIPCANLPISFLYECCHAFLYCGCLLSCLYSNNMHMSSFTTAHINSCGLVLMCFIGFVGSSVLAKTHPCMMTMWLFWLGYCLQVWHALVGGLIIFLGYDMWLMGCFFVACNNMLGLTLLAHGKLSH